MKLVMLPSWPGFFWDFFVSSNLKKLQCSLLFWLCFGVHQISIVTLVLPHCAAHITEGSDSQRLFLYSVTFQIRSQLEPKTGFYLTFWIKNSIKHFCDVVLYWDSITMRWKIGVLPTTFVLGIVWTTGRLLQAGKSKQSGMAGKGGLKDNGAQKGLFSPIHPSKSYIPIQLNNVFVGILIATGLSFLLT